MPIGGGYFGGVGTIAFFTVAGGRALPIGHGARLRGMHGGGFLPLGRVCG